MDALLEVCVENALLLIEDACQAHGAEYNGKMVAVLDGAVSLASILQIT